MSLIKSIVNFEMDNVVTVSETNAQHIQEVGLFVQITLND